MLAAACAERPQQVAAPAPLTVEIAAAQPNPSASSVPPAASDDGGVPFAMWPFRDGTGPTVPPTPPETPAPLSAAQVVARLHAHYGAAATYDADFDYGMKFERNQPIYGP